MMKMNDVSEEKPFNVSTRAVWIKEEPADEWNDENNVGKIVLRKLHKASLSKKSLTINCLV